MEAVAEQVRAAHADARLAVDATSAAFRWADTWRRAWPAKDVEAIAAHRRRGRDLPRARISRAADRGLAAVHRYLSENFAAESEIECWFGEPVVGGSRAAVEW